MRPGELAARLRARRRLDRSHVPLWRPPRAGQIAARLGSHFLFGPDNARTILESWRQARAEQAKDLLQRAALGLEKWEVFGVPVALDPKTIQWQSAPAAAGCDKRWIWELNRHQFLFGFARAFLMTAQEEYRLQIRGLLESWWEQNPFGCGVNWSSALEVGVRAISWLWTMAAIVDETEQGGGERFWRRWLAALHEHYQYLRGRLSLYTDPTNHLIGEAAALWLLSVSLPDLPGAKQEEQRGLEILAAEIARQVTPDGVSREQSIGYQRFVLDFYLQVMALARRTGRLLPAIIGRRVNAMLDFIETLAGEDGQMPAIGDSDDARGVPLAELDSDSHGDLLTSGAALLNRAVAARWKPESAVWLAGVGALDGPTRPAARRSRQSFIGSGYCFWAGKDGSRSIATLFDAGPLGLWPNASHGHADALSVQIRLGDRWVLGDPGTGSYSRGSPVRDLLRGTAAHNTVSVDGLNQTDPLDGFKWLRPAPAHLLEVAAGEKYDFALAMHEGYCRLRQPVVHYRALIFLHPPALDPGWVIVDRLEGAGRHRCELRFHFPPDFRVWREGPRSAVALDQSQEGLFFSICEIPGEGGPALGTEQSSLWSRRFGTWEQAPVLTVTRTAELPLTWFTFLTPVGKKVDSAQIVAARYGGTVLCRRVGTAGEERLWWTIAGHRHRFHYIRSAAPPGESCD